MQPTGDTFERVFSAKEKAGLRDEVFLGCELRDIDLAGADLRGATFHRTALVRCNLEGSDLRGASFVLCELREVVLTAAAMDRARFDGTTLVDVVGIATAERAIIEQSGGTFIHAHASSR